MHGAPFFFFLKQAETLPLTGAELESCSLRITNRRTTVARRLLWGIFVAASQVSKLPLFLTVGRSELAAAYRTASWQQAPAQRARSLGPRRARRLSRLVAASRLLFMPLNPKHDVIMQEGGAERPAYPRAGAPGPR